MAHSHEVVTLKGRNFHICIGN